jgi:hypothetical protein
VFGLCEHGNEPSGTVKLRKSLDYEPSFFERVFVLSPSGQNVLSTCSEHPNVSRGVWLLELFYPKCKWFHD